jgi:exopolysaccharide production protein ExoQ
MPPLLATLICILFILHLFRMDPKKRDGPSSALWIPLVWMFLAGGRFASSWLTLSGRGRSAASYAEGSPIDAAVFFLLISAGVFVLSRRKIDSGRFMMQNICIWLYFLYCGISIIWSDYSLIALKRWIKELGNPIMVLVILTEERPYEAVGTLLRRLSFLWLPLSILLIKYYPEMGRGYHSDGTAMFTGVGQQKNDLGLICLMSGMYFSWNFLLNRKGDSKLLVRSNLNEFLLLAMLFWLFNLAQSATSLACLVAAVSLFFMARLTAQKPSRIITWGIAIASLFLLLEGILGVSDVVIELLGRDPTLTARTDTWDLLKGMIVNRFFGAGYQSFWLGERLTIIWRTLETQFIQAHNGYLEQYLNLGLIGVAFIGAIMLSGLIKVQRHMKVDYPSAILRLSFIVTAILYNYTEASFYGINNMWLLLLLGVMEVSDQQGTKRTDSGNRHQQSG